MYKILLVILLALNIYAQENSTSYINPDGDVVSLTIMQNITYSAENSSMYRHNQPHLLTFSAVVKYPTSKRSTLIANIEYGNNKIFSKDMYKNEMYNTITVGIGATLYFK